MAGDGKNRIPSKTGQNYQFAQGYIYIKKLPRKEVQKLSRPWLLPVTKSSSNSLNCCKALKGLQVPVNILGMDYPKFSHEVQYEQYLSSRPASFNLAPLYFPVLLRY